MRSRVLFWAEKSSESYSNDRKVVNGMDLVWLDFPRSTHDIRCERDGFIRVPVCFKVYFPKEDTVNVDSSCSCSSERARSTPDVWIKHPGLSLYFGINEVKNTSIIRSLRGMFELQTGQMICPFADDFKTLFKSCRMANQREIHTKH
jgi:hypothetical protein